LINFLLWDVAANRDNLGGFNLRYLLNLLVVTVICGASATYGVIRYRTVASSDVNFPAVSTAAIQGALPQEMKWEPGLQSDTVELYRQLTNEAVSELRPSGTTAGPDILVVWPETAMPFFFQQGGKLSDMVRETARDINGGILFGTPAYQISSTGRTTYFNRACLIDEKGVTTGCYDKMHLVPFGEYLPWGFLTSWARELVPAAGDFTAGTSHAPLEWHRIRIGVLICFESIFPELARKSVASGANCLAVITNDSWFGDTGAPWQHAQMAAFRAVEQRRWLIRAANTGISEIISPTGQVVAKSALFRQDIVAEHIRLRDDMTVYGRFGDIPFLMFSLAVIALAVVIVHKRDSRSSGK
jgi:apolipoprotein N-acyltransferase